MSLSGAWGAYALRGFRLSPAPAVILCSAPPAHRLEEAIANSESRIPDA